jgi:hypothetical protein
VTGSRFSHEDDLDVVGNTDQQLSLPINCFPTMRGVQTDAMCCNVHNPKFHAIQHMAASLDLLGSALGTTTVHTERMHGVLKRESNKMNKQVSWPCTAN